MTGRGGLTVTERFLAVVVANEEADVLFNHLVAVLS